MRSCQAASRGSPGQVSVDSADDRERGDIGDGKAGPAYELVIDTEAFRGGGCGEISAGQRRRSAGEFGPGEAESGAIEGDDIGCEIEERFQSSDAGAVAMPRQNATGCCGVGIEQYCAGLSEHEN